MHGTTTKKVSDLGCSFFLSLPQQQSEISYRFTTGVKTSAFIDGEASLASELVWKFPWKEKYFSCWDSNYDFSVYIP
jgi:hypothetical protein